MIVVTFAHMQQNLLEVIRQRVTNGEITESQLARMVGMSQPHIHNVLKGARKLSTELADAMMARLRMDSKELIGDEQAVYALPFRPVPLLFGLLGAEMIQFDPRKTSGFVAAPSAIVATLYSPLAAMLGDDRAVAPRFETGDLVLIDQAIAVRNRALLNGVYIAMTLNGPRVRYVRQGGGKTYLASEGSLASPQLWERVTFTGPLSRVVRGRVVWLSRQLDGHSAGTSRPPGIAINAQRFLGGL